VVDNSCDEKGKDHHAEQDHRLGSTFGTLGGLLSTETTDSTEVVSYSDVRLKRCTTPWQCLCSPHLSVCSLRRVSTSQPVDPSQQVAQLRQQYEGRFREPHESIEKHSGTRFCP
jgi:hypothetical protein